MPPPSIFLARFGASCFLSSGDFSHSSMDMPCFLASALSSRLSLAEPSTTPPFLRPNISRSRPSLSAEAFARSRAACCSISSALGRRWGRRGSSGGASPERKMLSSLYFVIRSSGRGLGRRDVVMPPSCLAVRPPFFMPPTCFLPSRSSLASFWLVLARPTVSLNPRVERDRLVLASSPSTLPPVLNARREIGRMPVLASVFKGSEGVQSELSTLPPELSIRLRALSFRFARSALKSMSRSSEVIRRPGRGRENTTK